MKIKMNKQGICKDFANIVKKTETSHITNKKNAAKQVFYFFSK